MPKQAIVIMVDTQRHDMLGCYGNPDMHTPNLDALCAQGVRFDEAYTCQPVCGPARSAMFTGLFPHSNGMTTNSVALYANVKTVGQRLSDAAVHTGYIGKWHLDGGDYFGLGRCPEGWDPNYWYDMKCYLEELTPEERAFSRDFHNIQRGVPRSFTYANRVSNRAIDFIQKHKDEDYFLVVSYDEPHDPYLCPEPYVSMYEHYAWPLSDNAADDLSAKPAHQRAWAGDALEGPAPTQVSDDAFRAFMACNGFVDSEIGRVVDALSADAPEALIVYTADHGDMLRAHRITGKGPAGYEEITHIPFLVRWKEAPAGAVCPHPTSHIDLTPTMLDYFGLPPAHWCEGTSMLDVMRHPETRLHDQVFFEFGRYEVDHDGFGGFQPLRAAFDGRYKLIINLMCEDELYDLETDPGELNNLIHCPQTAAQRDRLHDAILNWMNDTRDPLRGFWWERRPWRVDARPATWAYTGMTRQREHEEYEPRQLDYATGLPMQSATRKK